MNKLTINIPEDMMQKLAEQDQPLQSLLLQAINEYLEKRSSVKTKTWELCGAFEVTNPHPSESTDETGSTNYAENLDRDLY
ncbi:hypothetical protein [Picosynechococcus sp. PCC 8807]|uniref:hypothetical protein n=1 Tax=Picosynechococcus sp. PCC 8807 TaxID=195248 RepID=UPI000810C3EB|nr:hypothetical protein [Picosynechococcus sp. PCC 8807]ANV90691.1 hypothetical protein AWQ24_08640 [Picosynechococcus sp. PCC 8807]